MSRKYGRISLILAATIVAGGLLVAFLGYSSPASQSVANYAGGGVTIPLTGGQYLRYAGVEGISTETMTATTTAISTATSIYVPAASSTISLSGGAQQSVVTSQQPQKPTTNGRFIEFFSNVTLRVPSPATAVDKASEVGYSLGGYVAYSALANTTAFVVLRVPSQNYQSALSQVESLGTILYAGSTSNDVAIQYTDLNATLLSLTTEQASLLKLLDQSTNVNSTLRVESILEQVNTQVNEVQSEILQTQRLVNYGTISVTFEKLVVTPSMPLGLKLAATPKSGESPLSVTFNAIVKGGTTPYIVNYNFGDGTSSEGQALIHTFGQPGEYNVTVTATDSTGNVSMAWTMVRVASPPVTSSVVSFPAYLGGLFLQVVEGIAVVAVVVLPIAGVAAVVLLPLRRRFGNHHGQQSGPEPQQAPK